jgi:hypothetical protein
MGPPQSGQERRVGGTPGYWFRPAHVGLGCPTVDSSVLEESGMESPKGET